MRDLPFPRNPLYGNGATRRRIHLWISPGKVRGLLTDIFHQMECAIHHDGEVVTDISGRMLRIPNTSCPSAPSVLPGLKGTSIGIGAREFYDGGTIRRHCTHLFDLAFYVISHASLDSGEIVYEAVMPDLATPDSAVDVSGWRDGKRELVWRVAREKIVAPASLQDRPVCGGFSGWAHGEFDGARLYLPLLMSRTCLLARGRAYQTDAWPGEPIARLGGIEGACYAYASERIHDTVFLGGNVRDFTQAVKE